MTIFKSLQPNSGAHAKGSRRAYRFFCILCGILASLLFGLVWLSIPASVAEAGSKGVIKFATLAPEGSSWMKQMRALQKRVESETEKGVRFKFYPGGVSGDEKDVIRKMRIGQIHAAGFTGVGLGEILPEVRVLDLPFLFRNDKEIAYIYKKMHDYFVAAFDKKGYVLLGWVPVGWIHFFSKNNIQSVEDLRKSKTWMWEGDPLVQAAYEAMQVKPHPLSVTDVRMALQTGMVNTVYASPVGALALQWFTKVNYMSGVRMGNATGGVLMSKKKFKRLSDQDKKTLMKFSKHYLNLLVQKIQKENNQAIEVMKKNGLKLAAEPSPEEVERFHKMGEETRNRLTGKLFSADLLNTVMGHLKALR